MITLRMAALYIIVNPAHCASLVPPYFNPDCFCKANNLLSTDDTDQLFTPHLLVHFLFPLLVRYKGETNEMTSWLSDGPYL